MLGSAQANGIKRHRLGAGTFSGRLSEYVPPPRIIGLWELLLRDSAVRLRISVL